MQFVLFFFLKTIITLSTLFMITIIILYITFLLAKVKNSTIYSFRDRIAKKKKKPKNKKKTLTTN